MKKIVNICICLLALFLCTSCFEIILTSPKENEFIVKSITVDDFKNNARYELTGYGNTIIIYDLPNKYQINDTLKIVKFSKQYELYRSNASSSKGREN